MTMMSAVVPSGSLTSSGSPGLLEQQENDRQRLLSALLNAVKACQTRFGGRSQLATESEPCVAALCAALEAVLWHGLRPKPASGQNSTLRQVTELVSTSLSLNRVQDIPAPWRFIRETLTRHEAERFLLLRRVCTDWGRGRAWLRACLNERSLERGLSSLRAAPSLATHYQPWAFLRDEERASTLTTMAAGLGSVLFAINVDSATFNEGDPEGFGDNAAILLGKSEPIIAATNSESQDGQGSKPQQLRRRRAPPHIVSFDDDSLRHSPLASTPPQADESVPCSSAPPTCLNSPVSPQPPAQALMQSVTVEGEPAGATLTPVTNQAVGELIPVFPGSCIAMTTTDEEDSLSVPSYSEDTDCAAAALLATQQLLEQQSAQLLSPASPVRNQGAAPSTAIIANEDPVAALRSLLSQCTSLETENRGLRASLRHEQAACSALLEELSEAKTSHQETLSQLQTRSQALSRENELLKHQLRKYVAAVQMLNRDGASAHQTLAGLAPALNQLDESRAQQQNEASQYEHKLVQVAEMHGELMEFNERLQRALYASESAAAQLRSELELLRGPLPSSRASMDPLLEPDSPTGVQSGALVHVWVPSAFLTGGTTDVHHVYQVYVRIRNDEWNVYRRYAQFHSLHRELKRKHPAVRAYDFPPKKTLGNKDARFVEERRLRLQKYLRLVVNLVVQGGAPAVESPHRDMLTKLLPFFGEGAASDGSRPHARSSSASRSPRPRASIPHYTGL